MSYYYVDVRVLVECDTESKARDIVENVIDDNLNIFEDFSIIDIKEQTEE